MDLADPALDVTQLLEREAVTAIVNCGAFTQVDGAEHELALARQVNGVAPGILARSAALVGIPIIQVSTDYVFSGTDLGWYHESDHPAPATSYGRSKLLGEKGVVVSGCCSLAFVATRELTVS